jgi:hypothetical protein
MPGVLLLDEPSCGEVLASPQEQQGGGSQLRAHWHLRFVRGSGLHRRVQPARNRREAEVPGGSKPRRGSERPTFGPGLGPEKVRSVVDSEDLDLARPPGKFDVHRLPDLATDQRPSDWRLR